MTASANEQEDQQAIKTTQTVRTKLETPAAALDYDKAAAAG